MNILKRILGFFASACLATLLFLFFASVSFQLRFGNPSTIKSWLLKSGSYDKIVESIIDESVTKQSKGEPGLIPLDNEGLRIRAREAFSPQLLGRSTETIIDSTYGWLRGDTPEPDFALDFTDAKSQFAVAVGEYAAEEYEKLPVCQQNQVAKDVDPFNDGCKIPGLTTSIISQQITNEIQANKDLFGNTKITADTFRSTKDPSKNVFADMSAAPKIFQTALYLPYVLGGLVILSIVVIYYTDENRRRGMRRIGVSFFSSGIILIISSLVALYLYRQVGARLLGLGSGGAISQNVVSPLLEQATQDSRSITLWFGIAYATTGVLFIGYCMLMKGRGRIAPSGSKVPHSRQHTNTVRSSLNPTRPFVSPASRLEHTARSTTPQTPLNDVTAISPSTIPPASSDDKQALKTTPPLPRSATGYKQRSGNRPIKRNLIQ